MSKFKQMIMSSSLNQKYSLIINGLYEGNRYWIYLDGKEILHTIISSSSVSFLVSKGIHYVSIIDDTGLKECVKAYIDSSNISQFYDTIPTEYDSFLSYGFGLTFDETKRERIITPAIWRYCEEMYG